MEPDIFDLQAFSLVTMATAIIKRPWKPNQLSMAFRPAAPVRSLTTDVRVNTERGRVKVLPSTPRGGIAPQRTLTKRESVKVDIPGYSEGYTLTYSEVSNILGGLTGGNQLLAAETLNGQYLSGCNDDLDVTWEHQMAMALQGVVVDTSGIVEIDLYDMMNVEQIVFDLDFSKPLIPQLEKMKTAMEKALGGDRMDTVTIVCGEDVMDAFSEHDDYRKAMSNPLWNFRSQDDGRKGVRMNQNVDIMPYYRGFFAKTDAYAVPIYDGHLQQVYGPSHSKDYLGQVLDRYVTRHELPHGKGLEVELWSYFLNYFQRPEAIFKINPIGL